MLQVVHVIFYFTFFSHIALCIAQPQGQKLIWGFYPQATCPDSQGPMYLEYIVNPSPTQACTGQTCQLQSFDGFYQKQLCAIEYKSLGIDRLEQDATCSGTIQKRISYPTDKCVLQPNNGGALYFRCEYITSQGAWGFWHQKFTLPVCSGANVTTLITPNQPCFDGHTWDASACGSMTTTQSPNLGGFATTTPQSSKASKGPLSFRVLALFWTFLALLLE